MKVYRVEHEEHGHGPYMHCGAVDCKELSYYLQGKHNGSPTHPSPKRELGSEWFTYATEWEDELHGFKSLEQMKAWFTNHQLKKLSSIGYVIHVYQTHKHYKITEHQVIFDDTCAKKVETISLI